MAYWVVGTLEGAGTKRPDWRIDADTQLWIIGGNREDSEETGMEGMMGMMKGNMAMIVPQTLIMGWINAFFSGFVISEFGFELHSTQD